MKKYRWVCPHEWLSYHFSMEGDSDRLRDALFARARKLDHDTIQGVFEQEMSEDGYFEPKQEELEFV